MRKKVIIAVGAELSPSQWRVVEEGICIDVEYQEEWSVQRTEGIATGQVWAIAVVSPAQWHSPQTIYRQ